MKALTSLLFCVVVALPLNSLRAATTAAVDPNTGAPLLVEVSVPRQGGENADPRLISAVVSRIRDVFQRRGYAGSIVEVTGRDLPNEGAALLKLTLADLKSENDKVSGAFNATLRTDTEKIDLGRFKGLELRVSPSAAAPKPPASPERATLSDRSLQELYLAIARTALVPGLTGN